MKDMTRDQEIKEITGKGMQMVFILFFVSTRRCFFFALCLLAAACAADSPYQRARPANSGRRWPLAASGSERRQAMADNGRQ